MMAISKLLYLNIGTTASLGAYTPHAAQRD